MKSRTAARTASAVLLAGAMLVPAGAATAASMAGHQSSQKIFADLADNGRLDGKYTKQQINRALHTPSLRGYERPVPVQRPAAVRSTPRAATSGSERSLPFSGLDLALFAAVGGPLLLLGGSLGRLGRLARLARLRVNET
jgi:hypothetical protein